MPRNEILDELHATRAKPLQQFGGDMHRYFREATEWLKASVRPIAKPMRKVKQRRKKTG